MPHTLHIMYSEVTKTTKQQISEMVRHQIEALLKARFIRRFAPKGTDVGKLTVKDVRRMQHWRNRYPRRPLVSMLPSHMRTLGVA